MRSLLIRRVSLSLKRIISRMEMASNELYKTHLTLHEAVDDELQSTENMEKDIVILPPAHGAS